ncbi:serine hydrolase [Chamaesiphon sp. OTE_8_metabat_110]|uniref:serine hydrolase n=1 Tax=Chamaesiphon sp. OTE_8_metabat_110 TaxID=2964696 RepID=UPI00286C29C9|nr:serine hydrolase [Chamaesiphon sp. OTE_8_metabat_110]
MASNSTGEQRSQTQSRRKQPSQQQLHQLNRSVSLSIQLVRLAICGLGASTIAGTTISIVNPPKSPIAAKVEPPVPPAPPVPQIDLLDPTTASAKLHNRLQVLNQKKTKLDASYLFINTELGEHSEWGADRVLPAASTIKLPILIALFQDVDAQKVNLAEKLTIDKNSIAGGSGDLQAQKPGTQVSILVAATKMITISDNTATNLLIARLGGKSALNQRFRNWGLSTTTINRPLPDLEGTNITTARELARSMMAIERGNIVSAASRSQILNIMRRTTGNTMLPQGLGAGAKIAHKTGDIGSLIADVGSIEFPTGKKYLAVVLVKRPYNDPSGPELVRKMSAIAYDYFQTAAPTPIVSPTSTPKNTSGFSDNVFIKKKPQ